MAVRGGNLQKKKLEGGLGGGRSASPPDTLGVSYTGCLLHWVSLHLVFSLCSPCIRCFFFCVCLFLRGLSVSLGVLAFVVSFFFSFFLLFLVFFFLGLRVALGGSVAVRAGNFKNIKSWRGLGGEGGCAPPDTLGVSYIGRPCIWCFSS